MCLRHSPSSSLHPSLVDLLRSRTDQINTVMLVQELLLTFQALRESDIISVHPRHQFLVAFAQAGVKSAPQALVCFQRHEPK